VGTGWRGTLALSVDGQKGLSVPVGHPLTTLLPSRARPPSLQTIILCHHTREGRLRKESPGLRLKGRLMKRQTMHNRVRSSPMQALKVPRSSPGSQRLRRVSRNNSKVQLPPAGLLVTTSEIQASVLVLLTPISVSGQKQRPPCVCEHH